MSTITTFVRKYGAEAGAVANALTVILEGIALSPAQANSVRNAIGKLETAAANLVDFKEPTTVKISKADIKSAVVEYLKTDEGKKLFTDSAK